MRKAAERYLQLLGATLRPRTVKCYRNAIDSFLGFLEAEYPELRSYAELRRHPQMEGWLGFLVRRQPLYAVKTRKEHICNLRRMLTDLHEQAWPDAPVSDLLGPEDIPRCPDCLPKPLSPQADAAVQQGLRERGDLVARMLLVARFTGVRSGELRALRRDCLIVDPGGHASIRVPLGKLHNERVVPVDPDTRELVESIRRECSRHPPWDDPETGQSVRLLACRRNGHPLSQSVLWNRIQSVAREQGVAEKVSVHRLRHTYATELVRAGMSLPVVQRLLGHRRISMTLGYAQVTQTDIIREFQRVFPRVREQYTSQLDQGRLAAASPNDRLADTLLAFEELIARMTTLRMDQGHGEDRKLQRLVERLCRARDDFRAHAS